MDNEEPQNASDSPSALTVEDEALRRCEIIKSDDYKFPQRLNKTDKIVSVIILVVALGAMWLGFLA
jgi:hypothetical protein